MIVTVVTPTLNGIEYLRQCIESARANEQPGVEVEHVIVDGGSTDGTVELAESYGLRVMKGKDKGIFDAINKGSFNGAGELLGFLGADDLLLDGAAADAVQAYARSGRRWVVGGIRWIDEHDRSLGELAAPPTWMTSRMLACLGWNPIMQMSTFISRDFYAELNGFDISYRDAGDYEMFCRALAAAPFERLSRPVACFRRTGHNNSAVNGERTQREGEAVLAAFGPKAAWERQVYRYALKSWFNFRNPHWLAVKLATPARLRLKLQQKAYF